MRRSTTICVLMLALALVPPAAAKPGDLDPSFGANGRAATPLLFAGGWTDARVGVATSPNGSTIVAAEHELLCFQPNGLLDRNFGVAGSIVVESVEGLSFSLAAVAIDGQGRILAFGTAEDLSTTDRIPQYSAGGYVHPSYAVVLRYDQEGRLDPTFGGGNGFVRTDLGLPHTLEVEGHARPSLVDAVGGTVDSEERPVLIGGQVEFVPDEVRAHTEMTQRLVARFTPDGNLDPTFGGGHAVMLGNPTPSRGVSTIRADNSIMVWGFETLGLAALATKLTGDGSADPSFGKSGATRQRGASGAAVVDRLGRLLLLEPQAGDAAGVVRLAADGSSDDRFGKHGRVRVRLPGTGAAISSLAVDRRGRPLLVGTAHHAGSSAGGLSANNHLLVLRLRSSGKLDKGFGHGGWVSTGFGRRTQVARAAIVPPDALGPQAALDMQDHLVVAAPAYSPQLGGTGIVLARYKLDSR